MKTRRNILICGDALAHRLGEGAAQPRVRAFSRASGTDSKGKSGYFRPCLFYLLVCVAVLVPFGLRATAPDADFDAANKLYGEGKFSGAADAYEKMIESGVASPAIYFNLGDAYFKSAQIGHAIAAYRQAAQRTPRDADVRANLQFARNQVTGPTSSSSRWETALTQLSLNEWTWLTVVAFWLLMTLLAARQIVPRWRNKTAVFLASAAFLVFGAGLGIMAILHHEKVAVVISPDAIIRNGPFDESPDSFPAKDGSELQVLDQKNDWFQVTDGHGRTGWVRQGSVAVVPAV